MKTRLSVFLFDAFMCIILLQIRLYYCGPIEVLSFTHDSIHYYNVNNDSGVCVISAVNLSNNTKIDKVYCRNNHKDEVDTYDNNHFKLGCLCKQDFIVGLDPGSDYDFTLYSLSYGTETNFTASTAAENSSSISENDLKTRIDINNVETGVSSVQVNFKTVGVDDEDLDCVIKYKSSDEANGSDQEQKTHETDSFKCKEGKYLISGLRSSNIYLFQVIGNQLNISSKWVAGLVGSMVRIVRFKKWSEFEWEYFLTYDEFSPSPEKCVPILFTEGDKIEETVELKCHKDNTQKMKKKKLLSAKKYIPYSFKSNKKKSVNNDYDKYNNYGYDEDLDMDDYAYDKDIYPEYSFIKKSDVTPYYGENYNIIRECEKGFKAYKKSVDSRKKRMEEIDKMFEQKRNNSKILLYSNNKISKPSPNKNIKNVDNQEQFDKINYKNQDHLNKINYNNKANFHQLISFKKNKEVERSPIEDHAYKILCVDTLLLEHNYDIFQHKYIGPKNRYGAKLSIDKNISNKNISNKNISNKNNSNKNVSNKNVYETVSNLKFMSESENTDDKLEKSNNNTCSCTSGSIYLDQPLKKNQRILFKDSLGNLLQYFNSNPIIAEKPSSDLWDFINKKPSQSNRDNERENIENGIVKMNDNKKNSNKDSEENHLNFTSKSKKLPDNTFKDYNNSLIKRDKHYDILNNNARYQTNIYDQILIPDKNRVDRKSKEIINQSIPEDSISKENNSTGTTEGDKKKKYGTTYYVGVIIGSFTMIVSLFLIIVAVSYILERRSNGIHKYIELG